MAAVAVRGHCCCQACLCILQAGIVVVNVLDECLRVYAGVGQRDKHDGGAHCGWGHVEGALLVVEMLAKDRNGCEDEDSLSW